MEGGTGVGFRLMLWAQYFSGILQGNSLGYTDIPMNGVWLMVAFGSILLCSVVLLGLNVIQILYQASHRRGGQIVFGSAQLGLKYPL